MSFVTETKFKCGIKDENGENCGKLTAYGIVDLFLVNLPNKPPNPNHIKSFINCAICEDCIEELFGFPKDWFWREYV